MNSETISDIISNNDDITLLCKLNITKKYPKRINRHSFLMYKNTLIIKDLKTLEEEFIYFDKNIFMNDMIIEGYISPGRILFYHGLGVLKLNDTPFDIFGILMIELLKFFGIDSYKVYYTYKRGSSDIRYIFTCDLIELDIIGDDILYLLDINID